ncbi:CHAT domain-containing protein [Kribbella solani]|uniref:CHAT domain-containing protein n=1 Tax=Kribbella solani TaxID=236067 RepID=UPI0029A66608|nr:CHAT domain-containing protein [Kribbella solani]MDX2971838.1 CHAT domain-containing protein [Kribbella solani]
MTDSTNPQHLQLYGDPFDAGFARAHEHHLAAEFAAASDLYAELLVLADSLEDSPDVRFLRAHLLADLTSVHLSASDLPGADDTSTRSHALLDSVAQAPMGPHGRQLWLELQLRTMMARSAVLSTTGHLDEALDWLDQAATVLTEFTDPDGLRAAELGLNRVLLLINRSEWGKAEEHASLVLATTPPTATEAIPRLQTALGSICTATGRYDLAEDYFAQAEQGFQVLRDTGEVQTLLAHRAYVAMERGELDEAEQLFTQASTYFEQQRRYGDLATCEQARSHLADLRGDTANARALITTSLDRFARLGASIAAADSKLLGAQHAYERGDIEELKRLAQEARDVYQAQELYERCAQVDLMLARTLEDNLNQTDHGDHERASVDTALSLALPAALTLAAARHDFVTAYARNQWLELANDAMRLVFRLAVRREDQGLLFELVEHQCAGAALALGAPPAVAAAAPVFPEPAMKTYGSPLTLGGVAADAAASVGLRVAPPPKVRMSAERVALQEYIAAAEFRYRRPIVDEQEVPFWNTSELTSRPVVQIRLADAGDLFMTWTWAGGATGFGTGRGPADEVDAAVRELAAALPGAGEGADGVRRAFASGALSDQRGEAQLARTLGKALLPDGLTAQLRHVLERAGRPLVRIQPSPRVAQVPWELLALDDADTRLLDLADVVTTAPTSLRRQQTQPSNTTVDWPVVLVLDPRVPGFRADSPLGSVLGPPGSDPDLLALVQRHAATGAVQPHTATAPDAFRRTDLNRDWLSDVLRSGARRLLYVGHVTGAPVEGGQSEDGAMHLSCGPETTGLTDLTRTHRPLSAKDLLLGTLPLHSDGQPGTRIWPAPPRVALIGCETGGDLRFTESFGLATAMLHNGAHLVTATRWPLPTNHAFHTLAGVPTTTRPLSEAITAVDTAHDHPDPTHHLNTWQRTQLTTWRTKPHPENSPLLWAALTTIVV